MKQNSTQRSFRERKIMPFVTWGLKVDIFITFSACCPSVFLQFPSSDTGLHFNVLSWITTWFSHLLRVWPWLRLPSALTQIPSRILPIISSQMERRRQICLIRYLLVGFITSQVIMTPVARGYALGPILILTRKKPEDVYTFYVCHSASQINKSLHAKWFNDWILSLFFEAS